jgi:multimeric flavodoxin WrbA
MAARSHRKSRTTRHEPKQAKVRKGQGSVALGQAEFRARFDEQFQDPAFDAVRPQIADVAAVAWDGYHEYRKSPSTRRAGAGFADPDFELPVEWLATRRRLRAAEKRQKDPSSRSRILIVCGASRSDQTCPGEMSKTFRLVSLAKRVVQHARGFEADVLDLSHLASEYGRVIHPCKACVSTAMPLCHWPCSCYPNHALGQVKDWMAEIYERFVSAHGVMIVTPVYWYGAPGGLKVMIDRLVCADGGNPDPTTTRGKDPALAKDVELAGWSYPKHLAGRAFAVVVHGDVEGVDGVRRGITDWLSWMNLVPTGHSGSLGRYVGYFEPYATSHAALDRDRAFQEEVRNAARSLVKTVRRIRSGRVVAPDRGLENPRPK